MYPTTHASDYTHVSYYTGTVYGDASGSALAVLRAAASLIAIGLGLNLLQLLPLTFPSLTLDMPSPQLPRAVRPFLFGASSALIASPCASPVLATILGYVATLGDPLLGCALLLCYTFGYTTPVLLAGVAAGSVRELGRGLDGGLGWVSPISGTALLAFGTYTGLQTAFGAV
mmetsp:Transcript_24700/g.49516  ORF Transcript_24700/g.49516 Transcript_24700/m.49516 type:complete len:172 (-) Transcript_24700:147-662(-)|eukprot:CAMPEP_0174703378 /NCGR_PEP_ID=MMETSP1094-20130205/7348_1 /TAXON_ID=156173 /ORGANISM="Chrysochromulina brevifilum, Strain UTEX LB 985" /LENGTH=171 /DNA_ID=CAMNT_0015901295 /DNA_START=382 /DNA_END=897 /DNA_ORIENTATION=+